MDKHEKYTRRCEQLLNKARAKRDYHLTYLQQCYRFTYPSREFDRVEGQSADTTEILDTTAVESVQSLVTDVIRLLFPSDHSWASIVYKNDRVEQLLGPDLGAFVTASNDSMSRHLSGSTILNAVGEAMIDNVVAGTSCLAIVDEDGPLNYMAVPINQIFFLENYDGRVDTVFRCHSLTGSQLLDRFPQMSKEVQNELTDCMDKSVDIIECVIPDRRKGNFTHSIYLKNGFKLVQEPVVSPFNPYIVWRWEKTLGEEWGMSPVRHALPTIKSANVMTESLIKNAEFASEGGWQTQSQSFKPDELKGKILPGSVVYTGDEPLEPLQFPGEYNVNKDIIEMMQAQIRALLLNYSLPQHQPGTTPESAAAVIQRREQFFAKVGMPAKRLQWELLEPVAHQVWWRLQQRGEMPKVPPYIFKQLEEAGFGKLKQSDLFNIEINAAIRQATRMQTAQNNMRAFQILAGTVGPESAAKPINVDKFVRRIYQDLGFSPDLLLTEREVKALEAQQQAMMQQQQQVADASSAIAVIGQAADVEQKINRN